MTSQTIFIKMEESFCHRIFFILSFATTCIMLAYISEMKDPTLIHTDGDKLMIIFFFIFSLFTYLLICAILMECKVICLLFVSLSGVLFAYMKYVHPVTHFLRLFMQTLLIMDAIVHLIFLFVCFCGNKQTKDFCQSLLNSCYNSYVQKSDIDTEEKKAGATKSVKKAKDMNYASMADTEVLIENIVIVIPDPNLPKDFRSGWSSRDHYVL